MSNVADKSTSKREKWDRESQRKSDDSGDSYDGPVVYLSGYGATSLDKLPSFFYALRNPSPEEKEAWTECRDEAFDLAQEHNVLVQSVSILQASADINSARFPIIIISVPSTKDKGEWKSLIISVCKMLHAKDCLKLGVAIFAPDERPNTRYYSVETNDPLVDAWPRLETPILDIIGKMTWNLIAIVRAGETDATAVPTIVISTRDPNNAEWSSIKKSLANMCRGHDLGELDTVVFGITSSEPTACGLENLTGTPVQHLYENLEMGQSIGVDAIGSGTLGGHVKLVYSDGNSEVLGMTCYHVVRPEHSTVINAQQELKNGAWDSDYDMGVKHLDNSSPFSAVQAPSIHDHSDHYTKIQRLREEAQNSLDSASHWKSMIDAGMAKPPFIQMYADLVEEKRRIDEELSEWTSAHSLSISAFENELAGGSEKGKEKTTTEKDWIIDRKNDLLYGSVKYSSGFRTTSAKKGSGHRLDWALIKPISNGRRPLGTNKLPPERKLTAFFDFHEEAYVHGFAHDEEREVGLWRHCCRTGRTSGLTIGEYNYIHPSVNIDLPPNSDNPEGGGSWIMTREHSIIRDPREYHPPNCGVTSREGDSGAWVINRRGELMGMIWGDKTLPDIFACFTSVETLVADIKQRTGCVRVELS